MELKSARFGTMENIIALTLAERDKISMAGRENNRFAQNFFAAF